MSTLAVCLAGTLPLAAEEHKVPKVLQIIREDVKPGRAAAHTKSESAWVAALRKGGDTSYYLAMTGGGAALYMTPCEEQHGKAYQDALGDDTRTRIRDFQRSAVKSSETEIYEFSPKMSYLSKAFTDRDPDYWTPKPAPAPAKEEKKKP